MSNTPTVKRAMVTIGVGLRILGLCGLLWTGAGAVYGAGAEWVTDGQAAYDRGALQEAAASWQRAVAAFRAESDPAGEIAAAVSLAGAYQELGQHRRAVQALESAARLSAETAGRPLHALVNSRLGAALAMTRDYDRANSLLVASLAEARTAADTRLTASILNDQGNLFTAQEKLREATAAYGESAALARSSLDKWMAAQALANAAAVCARLGENAGADNYNSEALKEIRALDDVSAKAFLLVSAAQTDRQVSTGMAKADADRLLLRANDSLTAALRLGEQLSDRRIQTYALGYLGHLYEQDGQLQSALELSRRASFVAQQSRMPEALYRWQWQIGRLLKKQGKNAEALAAYRRAVEELDPIRADVSMGSGNAMLRGSFRQAEGPLFLELADLLLQQAEGTRDPVEEQRILREARDTVEQLKAVELQDYLCDDCVDVARAKTQAIEAVDPRTAVVYFISLPDRTETLLGTSGGLKRYTLRQGSEALTREVRAFRRHLETRTSYEYLEQAQRLHAWLIQPLREQLAPRGIDTLVFVPDGALRTIPFGALHDGERFLIESYAVAVAPGLSLVDPRPISQERARVLLGGVTEQVQGFPPLQFVSSEIETIAPLYRSEVLLDRTFTLEKLQRRLTDEQFSIVHIASHGQFDRDVRKTFLLTHDTKLTLNALEAVIRPAQYRGRPVELLVLSACQTAAGDDRAALGLAGVAVKAGARSALATLWFVNDQSTSALISEVYQQFLKSPDLSKARALQAAQIKLLHDRRYRHPCYWSPYLMIGNWL